MRFDFYFHLEFLTPVLVAALKQLEKSMATQFDQVNEKLTLQIQKTQVLTEGLSTLGSGLTTVNQTLEKVGVEVQALKDAIQNDPQVPQSTKDLLDNLDVALTATASAMATVSSAAAETAAKAGSLDAMNDDAQQPQG